jgi:ABC-2 type transport system permease protein
VLALALGTVSFAALGIALASLIRSGDGASAVVNAVYLPMSFLAGSFWTPQQYPHFLKVIAELLPLTYFIRLMRDVTVRNETIWTDWKYAAAVGAWGLVGLVLAVRSFRWAPREG